MSNSTRKMLKIASIHLPLCFLFLSLAVSVRAADVVAPRSVRLEPLSEKVSNPTDVAIDSSGKIYVVESGTERLLVFGPDGEYLRTRVGLARPIAVAVGFDGKVYVGNVDRKNVEIYDGLKLKMLGKLGSGDGEFYKPTSIAVDADGNVYVADGDADAIKVYNSTGVFQFSIGGKGYGDGKFNFPSSLAIDYSAKELIVTDLQRILSPDGEHGGARIQIFTLKGEFKKSFGHYGVGEGELVRPLGVAVDSLGRIYATDALQQVVQVYNKEGDYLGPIYDLDNPMRTPLGIDFCEMTSRLFIASTNTKKVEVYGIDNYKIFEKKDLPATDEENPTVVEPEAAPEVVDATAQQAAGDGQQKPVQCFISTILDR